jgi:hypothetical protein
VRDSELTDEELAGSDLFLLGGPADNAVVARLAGKLPAALAKGSFAFEGKTYARSDEGLYLCVPNPWNPKRVAWVFAANSALQLHQMTKGWAGSLPQWAVYRGDEAKAQGWAPVDRFVFEKPGDGRAAPEGARP